MTVRTEAFLAIEAGLTDRLSVVWQRLAAQYRLQLTALLIRKDYAGAADLANSLDLSPIIEENKEYIRYSSYSALLFGASRLNDNVKNTVVAAGGFDDIITAQVKLVEQGILVKAADFLRDQLLTLIAQAQHADPSEPYGESDTTPFLLVTKFNPNHDEKGQFSSGDGGGKVVTYEGLRAKVTATPEYKKLEEEELRTAKVLEEKRALVLESKKDEIRAWNLKVPDNPFSAEVIDNMALHLLFSDKKALEVEQAAAGRAMNAAHNYVHEYLMANMPPDAPFLEEANQFNPQTELPEFKKWFGDSQVVSDEGKPLVVFHGSDSDIKGFDTQISEPHTDFKTNPNWCGPLGTWFAGPSFSKGNYDPGNAEFVAGDFARGNEFEFKMSATGAVVYPVYLSIKKPMEFEGFEDFQDQRGDKGALVYRNKLIKQGYDGVVIRNSMTDGDADRDDWVAFYPEQIKSAIGNKGTFDPKSRFITKVQKGGPGSGNYGHAGRPGDVGGSGAGKVGEIVDSLQKFAAGSEGSLKERIVILNKDTHEVLADYQHELQLTAHFTHEPTPDSGFSNADMFDTSGQSHPDNTILHLHTHPIDETFSDGDWRIFTRTQIGEMRVVTKDNEYRLVKTPAFTNLDWKERTPVAIRKVHDDIQNVVFEELTKALPDDPDVVHKIIQETTVRMAKHYGVDYTITSLVRKGGGGSGNFGHSGRPGEVGGSGSGGDLNKMLEKIPVKVNPNLRNEATTTTGVRVEVGPKFAALTPEHQLEIMTHEAAHFHGLDDWYLKNHSNWDLAELNGQTTPGEIIAEAYSLLWHDPNYLDDRAPGLAEIIRRGAAVVGMPVPPVKKYDEDQLRDDRGRWTSGGSIKDFSAKDQARLKALKMPPAWTDIKLNPDETASLQVIGHDAKGRSQYLYSAAHSEEAAAEKFSRLKDFHKQLPGIREQFTKDAAGKPSETQQAAAVVYLIDKTGFRIGSDADTKTAHHAFGASTLEGQHVKVDGNKVTFSFTGKKGVRINKTVTDEKLAGLITAANPQVKQPIFDSSDAKVRDYFHSVAGKDFQVKDFRTWHGTRIALSAVKGMRLPKTAKEYKKMRKEVAEKVSRFLGNTPAVALSAYINPAVFKSWGALKSESDYDVMSEFFDTHQYDVTHDWRLTPATALDPDDNPQDEWSVEFVVEKFEEELQLTAKYNPNHDAAGRFSWAEGLTAIGDETGDKPPAVGKSFIVFRVGAHDGLDNRNAGNANGVAIHLVRGQSDEGPINVGGTGTVISAYKVTVHQDFEKYSTFNLQAGGSGTKAVGRTANRAEVTYSFPKGGAWTATPMGSVKVKDVERHLKKKYRMDSFDDAGGNLGAVAIRDVFIEQVIKPAKKGGPGSGNRGHAGRPGEVGGSGAGGLKPPESDAQRAVRYARARKMGFDTEHVWYHGTFVDFEEFQRKFANTDAYFGDGFYFSSDAGDVAQNYESAKSPDIDFKIQTKVHEEQEKWDEENSAYHNDVTQERIDAHNKINEEVRANFSADKSITLSTFLRVKNPLDLTTNTQQFDFSDEDGKGVEVLAALDRVMDRISDDGSNVSHYLMAKTVLLDKIGGATISATELLKQIHDTEQFQFSSDKDGRFIGAGRLFREMAEEMGYDALIMDASKAFPTLVPWGGVKHTIIFEPKNIRSITAKFDPKDTESANIRKFNPYHDEQGRFTSGAELEPGEIDKRIVDYKPDRALGDPKKTVPITDVLPNAEYVPYSKTPFFDAVNSMQGTPDPMAIPVQVFLDARDKLFESLPVKQVPMDRLVLTQKMVNMDRIKEIVDDPKTGGSKPIHVVRYKAKTYILNGHHRVVAEVIRGTKTIESHVLVLKSKNEELEDDLSDMSFEEKVRDLIRRAEDSRVLDPFQTFTESGDALMQMVSSLHTSRLSAFGFTAEAEVMGVEEYALSAQLDKRVCDVCALMHGRRFQVSDARGALDTILHVDDLESLKTIQAWPPQDVDSIEEMADMTDEEIVERNWMIPPFHPSCRCLLVHVGSVPRIKDMPSFLASSQIAPEDYLSTIEGMREYGVSMSQRELAFWNAEMAAPLGDVLAGLTGENAQNLLDTVAESADENGVLDPMSIGLSALAVLVGSRIELALERQMFGSEEEIKSAFTFDTSHSRLLIEELESDDPFVQRRILNGAATVAERVSMAELSVSSDVVDSLTMARAGFLPSPEDWNEIRAALAKQLAVMEGLTIAQTEKVGQLLADDNPLAMRELALYKTSAGRSVGQDLLDMVIWVGTLELDDNASMVLFDRATKFEIAVNCKGTTMGYLARKRDRRLLALKGGAGSGNFNHEGRPGEIGGSGTGGFTGNVEGIPKYINQREFKKLSPEAQKEMIRQYRVAAIEKPAFDKQIQEIADKISGGTKLPELKGSGRGVEKVIADYQGDAKRIKDILRATITVDNPNLAQKAIDALTHVQGTFETMTSPKDGFRNWLDPSVETVDGYRDAKINVKIGGIIAEIQIHVPAMLEVKSRLHEEYVLRSEIYQKMTKEGRDTPTSREQTRIDALNAKMKAAYDPVWKSLINARKSAFEI